MPADLFYKPGSFWRIDDRTGFKVRAEHTRKQWNNIIVRDRSFEERQPQDFVRGRRDDQTVPQPRPRSTNVFLGVQTAVQYQITLSNFGPGWSEEGGSGGGFAGGFSTGFSTGFQIGSNLLVQSVIGFNVGDSISIQLDNGSTFFTTVAAINFSSNTIQTSHPLPFSASGGNIVTDMTSFANV
jgi:hypothetical protein